MESPREEYLEIQGTHKRCKNIAERSLESGEFNLNLCENKLEFFKFLIKRKFVLLFMRILCLWL